MENLKNYDDKLIYFIIFNISLVILISNYKIITENSALLSLILTASILYLPIYIINNIIPREFKFFIIYPTKKPHRFSSDLFTKLKNNKIKYNKELINLELILNTYGNPKTNQEEDKLWYELYNKHRYDHKIYQQNRQFLLSRDITTIVIFFTIIFLLITIIFKLPLNQGSIIIIGIIELMIFREITIKNNKTFALSVLQEETKILKKLKLQTSTQISQKQIEYSYYN